MKAAFSGAWKSSEQTLTLALSKLAKIAENDFDIEISPEKMIAEIHYRQLVLSELSQLNHTEINKIISWLTSPREEAERTVSNKTNRRKHTVVLLSLVILISAVFIFFPIKNNTDNIVLFTETVLKKTEASPIVQLKQNEPTQVAEVAFRLHGSNTIGEKLAPALLESFLKEQGITDFTWIIGESLVEKTLSYNHNGKQLAIELHAHGSSTAFTDLKLSKADMGMASRRIKSAELNELKERLGPLNQVGNEHIIGLDGLAVIVNQNNPLKQLSSEALALVFSGEIDNWSQLGGIDKPITLYSRDKHSGTWDTFKSLVLKKYNKKLASHTSRFESSSELSTKVSQDENAIGFIGLNYVLHNKALAIAATKSTAPIFPTRFTVGTEDYALARRLYFYTPTSASPIVKSFAQFAISSKGQNIVAETGLISQNIKLEETYPQSNSPTRYNYYVKNGKRLSLNFRFDYATKDLDNKGKRDLHRLLNFMEQHNGRRIALLGFSDSIGAQLKNQNLSLKRAKSVELELTSRGIPVISVEGFGEALPIANNNTESGRKRNRRVEVWLL